MRLVEAPRRIPRGRTANERRAMRSGISLRAMGISLKQRRYLSAVALLLPCLQSCTHAEQLDALCEEWVEYQWEKGTPLGTIGDALSGLHFYWPQAKGWLRGAWKLFKNWRRIEAPVRAPPLPLRICQALVGVFLELQHIHMCFLVALGFHAYLRTGELLRLRFGDVSADLRQGVVTVRASKSGLRFNIDEAVTLTDRTILSFWQQLLHTRPDPTAFIWSRGARAFRAAFYQGLAVLDVSALQFQPYSLRRGGATHHFLQKRTVDSILIRGRWRSLSVARLYLEDGLATLQQLQMSPRATALVSRFASPFHSTFLL